MSERPWIEWLGGPRPLSVGQRFDYRLRSGVEVHGVILPPRGLGVRIGSDGKPYAGAPARKGERDAWEHGTNWPLREIIAYRLSDDGAEAEAQRSASRIASFRKLTEVNPLDVRPVRVPAPKRERV